MLDDDGIQLLNAIAEASAGSLSAAIFFGSRSSGVSTTAASAYDLMLVCEAPAVFYRSLHRAGLLQRSPTLLGLVDGWLAPTQIRLTHHQKVAKATVVSIPALEQATSNRRRDQFLAGRLFQDVHLVWTKNGSARERIELAILSARRITLDWVMPDLPPLFDAERYVRQLFRTSFRFEVRPENRGRADALYEAQSAPLKPLFAGVLEAFAAEGRLLVRPGGGFALPSPVTAGTRIKRRLFLEWSRLRALARWPKHAITFDGWLDYIVRKAERHSGETIVLSSLERRLPFLFLWPRIFRFLLRQRRKGRPI